MVTFIIVLLAFPIYLFHTITKGVGNAAEKSIRAIYEVSKSLDSTDLKKLDSIIQEVSQKRDSSKTNKPLDR